MKFKEFILKIMGEPVNKAEETEALTLRDAFTAYIWDCRKNQKYSEPTIDSYEVIRDKHLQWIIDRNIFALTEEDCQIALNNERAKGMSISTVKKYRTTLMRVFEAYRPEFKPKLEVC